MEIDNQENPEELPEWLVALLVCPVDRGSVSHVGTTLECAACGRRYPIRDGIPIMIPQEAEEAP